MVGLRRSQSHATCPRSSGGASRQRLTPSRLPVRRDSQSAATWIEGPIGIYLNSDRTGRVYPDGEHNVFKVSDLPEQGKDFYVEGVTPATGEWLKADWACLGGGRA